MSGWVDLEDFTKVLFYSDLSERKPDKFVSLFNMVKTISKKHHADLNLEFGESFKNEKELLLKDFSPETEKLFQKFLEELKKEGIA